MRILFLADAVFKDMPGGSRTAARELAVRLVEDGHSVTFLVGKHHQDSPDRESLSGFQIVRYPGAGSTIRFISSGRQAMLELLKTQTFDIVHTHFAFASVGPLSVLPKSIPRVRTFHGPWDEEGWIADTSGKLSVAGRLKAISKRSLRIVVEKSSLRNSEKIIVLSNCFRDKVLQRYGVSPSKIVKIPGGCDLNVFHPVNALQVALERKRLNLPMDRRIILTVRRLTPRMGIENLITAMPRVLQSVPDAFLVVGGSGDLRQKLEQTATDLGVNNHVRFVGFIPDAELPCYYQTADLFVLPTMALEGFGLVTIEALACGTPVVGTPVGATPEILGRIDKRLIAKGATPIDLAERMVSFFTDDWGSNLNRDVLGTHCEQNYSWNQNVALTEELYRSVQSHRPEQAAI